MFRCLSLWAYPTWSSLNFFDHYIKYVSWNLGNSYHYFFKYFLSFYLPLLCFWDYHYTYLDKFDSISQVSKGLLIFLQYFSLIIRLETSYWPCFRHIDPYAISNLLLSQWSKFFISIIILFNSILFSNLLNSLFTESLSLYFPLILYTWFPLFLWNIYNSCFEVLCATSNIWDHSVSTDFCPDYR